ncbi:hypothetical protein HDU96_009364 [Phlyctochytrium bullatum]|nr:hypothetical protein HDU96_009364 [Phlyctochytrium bullatum]
MLEIAVAAASNASETNFPRRPSQALAGGIDPAAAAAAAAAHAANTSALDPLSDHSDDEPYVPPRVVVEPASASTATPEDPNAGGGIFRGFVRRISNAFASLTSPVPADDRKELPAPVAEETPVPVARVPPPPPPAGAVPPPPPPVSEAVAAEAEAAEPAAEKPAEVAAAEAA